MYKIQRYKDQFRSKLKKKGWFKIQRCMDRLPNSKKVQSGSILKNLLVNLKT